MTTFNDVSVKSFQDADAIYAVLDKAKMMPFFSVSEVEIQPGTVILTYNPLVDGIKWEYRKRIEIKENGETFWMSSSADGRWTKFTTTRKVDRDRISLAAYLSQKEEEDNFTPAKIKFADISSFRERVLKDAKDVARGLGLEINSLLRLAFKDAFDENLLPKRNCTSVASPECSSSNNPGCDSESVNNLSNNALPSSPTSGYIQNSAVMATHTSLPSLPGDNLLDSTTHHRLINKGLGTMRMGEQRFGTSRNDNGDWTRTTCTPGQRQRWGPLGGDVSSSERGKRKTSHDASEKTRKKQKTFLNGYSVYDPSLSHEFVASSSSSDARYVGFRSLQEVTQSEGSLPLTRTSSREDSQLDQAVTQEDQHRFYYEIPTPQEVYFEEYPNTWERFADMSDIPRISTWQPRCNLLDRDLVFQHSYGDSFKFAMHPSQDRSRNSGHFQNADQSYESFTVQEGGCGYVIQYAHEGIPATSSQHMQNSDFHQTQLHPLGTPLEDQVRAYLPKSFG